MHNTHYYESSLGKNLLAADDEGLTGLWLDEYFTDKNPNFIPKLHITGTDFQNGHTVTYSELADKLSTSALEKAL